ncbi:protein of unknown function [Taphrina deformans PYCC 5710]|uniref:Translation initiation factor eIF2B subunit delta n=1 Tax=Taphrina deformans (strain PYCC 5710 / ATCC 11124 / CBS 356.35 / IMI 108563 / JCM 9778 / NBRC 8474) TaxID=1097556 RepID=R4XDA4_TAPDE|nr:protein of unknown function [Taphrina deformans PYCC 5710]|eukprot:CCG83861.1 protein of unknown function [Taphrina deformans PYCC 5710]
MSEDKNAAKALKAQRRAQKVAAKTKDTDASIPTTQISKAEGERPHKQQQASKSANAGKADHKKSAITTTTTTTTTDSMVSTKSPSRRTVALFSHLEQKVALTSEHIPRDIHPAVITFALQCSSGMCIGSNQRCIAMLRTFQKVIQDYSVPQNLQTSLQRHLPTYLSAQISYLVTARPLSISMGSAIRLLKQQISKTDIEASDETNKDQLIEFIDTFIRERIIIAGQVIVKAARTRFVADDVILVYAHSTIVEAILLEAFSSVPFKVIVVDSRPKFEGRLMVRNLAKAGIPCTYVMLSAIGYVMETVDKVFLGAHTVLANGAVYSRAGTALVAMTASEHHVPVIVACETYKFSDRVQLDSFVTNELGLTSEIDTPEREQSAAENIKALPDVKSAKTVDKDIHVPKDSQVLKLNLLYDVTPDKYITLCISELGSLPTTAIPFAALSEQNA